MPTKKPARRPLPERFGKRLELATADLQKSVPVKAPPAKRAAAHPKKPGGGGVGAPAAVSSPLPPSVLTKRRQRTAEQVARVTDTLKNIADQEIGGANRAEVLDRTVRVLKEVDIERYPNSRLDRTVGLPKDWIGRIWEAIVLSLKWLRDACISAAEAELLELNRQLTKGGAVRFGMDGLVYRIVDLKIAERPGAFNGEIVTLLKVRLLPKAAKARTVEEARAKKRLRRITQTSSTRASSRRAERRGR